MEGYTTKRGKIRSAHIRILPLFLIKKALLRIYFRNYSPYLPVALLHIFVRKKVFLV